MPRENKATVVPLKISIKYLLTLIRAEERDGKETTEYLRGNPPVKVAISALEHELELGHTTL